MPAKDEFVSSVEYAKIFIHFYDVRRKEFIKKCSENKPKKFKGDLTTELKSLYQE